MKTQLLFATLLSSGLCSLSSSVPRQFHVVKELMNWTEAQQYCREKFTDLATIDDMAEMERVKRLIQRAGVGNAWIGLKQGNSPKWQWSLADRDFYRGNEAEFRKWDSIQPNGMGPPNQFKDVNCVLQKRNGLWNDFGCSETFPFTCYDVKNSTHPYVLVNEGKNWTDAQRYCREKHTDLASVRNQTENNQIGEVSGGRDVWIGLFRDAWEWSDNGSSSFRHWLTGEPNLEEVACTEIAAGGLWNDVGCHHKQNFICYEAPKERQIVRVNFTVDSRVNVSDPYVQQAILQQIQERLRKKGMPADVKLDWRKQSDRQVFQKRKEKKEEGKKRMKRNEL